MTSPDFSELDPHSFDIAMMRQALELAHRAAMQDEVPVGAIVVRDRQVVARGYNLREHLNDPTAHAERLVLTEAGRALRSWRLEGCTLYVTLEPCPMCAGAILQGRISRLVYGAADPKAGACRSLYRLADDPRLPHRVAITPNLLADECGLVLKRFFETRRQGPRNPSD